jgi:uncharacterized protein
MSQGMRLFLFLVKVTQRHVQLLLHMKALPGGQSKGFPVHEAILSGHATSTECLRLLLQAGAVVDDKDGSGRTALAHLRPISRDYATRTALLIAAGASPARLGAQPWPGILKLCPRDDFLIERHAHESLTRTELEASEALINAAKCGSVDAVRILIKQPEIPADFTDAHGRTALHYAAMRGEGECVSSLLRGRASPNILDKDGASAISMAAFFGHVGCIQVCILDVGVA